MEPEDLYGLPLERFTDERNALAKERRNDGRRDEAEEVSKLRKPSIAAWAVNQLVRTQRRDIAALCDAGDALREAQEKLLSGGGDADALRDAVEAVRVAVEQLTDRARGLLSSEGNELSPATLARVSETLNAAALNIGDDGYAVVHALKLGALSNTLNVDTINIGTGNRAGGSLTFNTSTGTLQVRNLDTDMVDVGTLEVEFLLGGGPGSSGRQHRQA